MIAFPLRTVPGMNVRDFMLRDLSYDDETGVFKRVRKSGPNVVVGGDAGHVDAQGYRRVRVGGKLFAAHRLAWLWVHGVWPSDRIDHINGVRDDNRIQNLRIVDHSTNLENQRSARKDNRVGVLGVRPDGSRFNARIWVKGKPIHLGNFATVDEARSAYVEAKRKLHAGCTL